MYNQKAYSHKHKKLAAVQVFFSFTEEEGRIDSVLKAYEKNVQSDVRILTVEVILKGNKPILPLTDKLVVEVNHPAWYKVSGINFGARHLISEGYEYIAWLDADSYIEPLNWGDAAVTALSRCSILHLGERVVELRPNGKVNEGPSICINANFSDSPDFSKAFDGGAWASSADFFTELGGLWPYSIVEGGNKILLYPFMKESMKTHPLVLATQNTPIGESLEQYWSKLIEWNAGRRLDALRGHTITLCAHGSDGGRQKVWAVRYAFYRKVNLERDIYLTPEGLPQTDDPTLRGFLELILKERAGIS